MKTAAIIAEYNPFHQGHFYQLQEAKSQYGITHTLAVMSGNFVQRGTPALLDKFARATLAVSAGVDAVIELPFCYATASASDFAMASIILLNKIGSIDFLVFGAEDDNLPLLSQIADLIINETKGFKSSLKKSLQAGNSFAAARAAAIAKIIPEASTILDKPNNILAIEYLVSLKKTNSPIEPILIKRVGAEYNDTSLDSKFPSATSIRNGILHDMDVSMAIPEPIRFDFLSYFEKSMPLFENDFTSFLQYKLLTTNFESDVPNTVDLDEALFNRLANISPNNNYSTILMHLKSKNITQTRVNRAILHLMINLTKDDYSAFKENGWIFYGHVLAMNGNGGELLRAINSTTSIPVFTKIKAASDKLSTFGKLQLAYDIKATNMYNTAVYNKFNTTLPNDFTNQFKPLDNLREFRIAICDDNKKDLSKIINLVHDYLSNGQPAFKYKLFKYTSAEELLMDVDEKGTFDIALLDIKLSRTSGIDAALEMRRKYPLMTIIYVSNHGELKGDTFETQPFHFVDKPLNDQEFLRVFGNAFSTIKNHRDVLTFTANKINYAVPAKDIMYVEREGRYTIVVTEKERISTKLSLKSLKPFFEKCKEPIIKANAAYFVNLNHYTSCRNSLIIMSDKKDIALSQDGHRRFDAFHKKKLSKAIGN